MGQHGNPEVRGSGARREPERLQPQSYRLEFQRAM